MTLRDKYGWPVETICGRWFTNAIRLLLHTNMRQTLRNQEPGICVRCGEPRSEKCGTDFVPRVIGEKGTGK